MIIRIPSLLADGLVVLRRDVRELDLGSEYGIVIVTRFAPLAEYLFARIDSVHLYHSVREKKDGAFAPLDVQTDAHEPCYTSSADDTSL